MAKKSETPRPYLSTKKHMARQEIERRQTTIIIAGTVTVLIIIIALITVPFIIQNLIQPSQPIAIVNNDEISTGDWQTQTKYYRYSVIRRIENTLQLASLFGNDPNTLTSITSQLQPLMAQLEPLTAGQSTLEMMTDDTLISQEIDRRGITLTEEEIEKELQSAFGYYADGTPTPTTAFEPIPTSTLSSLQQTLVPPTETATPGDTLTTEAPPTEAPTSESSPTVEATPSPSPTPYTFEGYQKYYKETLNGISDIYGISESDIIDGLRYNIITQLHREKLMEDMFGDISCSSNQVWARHILVEEEQVAIDIHNRLNEGEDFCSLASELSTDPSNKDSCGDLGWFGEDRMVKEFEDMAFALNPGEISEPVETQFGWHVIQSLGNEDRVFTDTECDQRKLQAFDEWLIEARNNSTIEIMDYWVDRVPEKPELPLQTQLAIQQLLLSSASPGTLP
jgi:parvulin-like peptidyl-prolyl isomerase